jgi:L-malate glycosyltransferase
MLDSRVQPESPQIREAAHDMRLLRQSGQSRIDALRKVLVIQRRMPHYRVAFFEALRREAPHHGLELVLAYGDPTHEEGHKEDSADIQWAQRLPTRYFFGGRVCWQPYSHLMPADGVTVITHENKLVNNLPVQLLPQRSRIVLWGHGANLQGKADAFRERFKRWLAGHADWWLGYTEISRALIEGSGFPADRITILDNAVDTAEMAAMRARVTPERLAQTRLRLGLRSSQVGVFVGSMYAEKRIGFLLQAAGEVRRRVPDFELLVIGGGVAAGEVASFCSKNKWAHFLGVCKGQDKVDALALARVMLNPGLIGLGILDSFVCGVPMLTTDCGLHSPEIAYLRNGINGVMTLDALPEYSDAVVRVLTDDSLLVALQMGCAESAAKYTVENMAANFCKGVASCLVAPPLR